MTSPFGTLILAQEDTLPVAPSVSNNGSQAPSNTTTTTGQPGAPNGPAPQPSPFGNSFLFMMVALMGLMIFMSVMSGRKEKKRVASMLSSIKRHDRVMLAGGMIGTIAEVRDDEVVVKVDESTNTRIHFRKSAIQQVLRSSTGENSPAETSAA